jgi:tetratricopeptide (TPR) repeat protein
LLAGLWLGWAAGSAPALPRLAARDFSPTQQRGAEVGTALLVQYYQQLPEREPGEDAVTWARRLRAAVEAFRNLVTERYTEATLQRLLDSTQAQARRAAVFALSLVGTMRSNPAVAALLRDDDAVVRRLAVDTLWSLWFRADTEANNQELQRVMRLRDPEKALAGFDALIRKAPQFAEAYNQRAILYWRLEEFDKSVADCVRVLQLNPYHFGAQSGMAQCYLKLKNPRAALEAFRSAYLLHPTMEGVAETIRALESALGEEGKSK